MYIYNVDTGDIQASSGAVSNILRIRGFIGLLTRQLKSADGIGRHFRGICKLVSRVAWNT